MSGPRNIYWICPNPSPAVWEKVEILHRFHIETRILPDFAALARSYAENRLNTIIIDDESTDPKLPKHLQKISVHPEYAGVRFILSLSKPSPDLVELAIALGFRDVLPLDMPAEKWIRRYVFAAAGQATDLADPVLQLSLRSMAALHVPARVSWLTDREIWLETRLLPPVGSQLNLSGGLADELGVRHISLKVLEHHQTHLQYRYSDALLCRWNVPQHQQNQKQSLLQSLAEQKDSVPYRIYTIVRSQDLRKRIVKLLDPRQFQMAVALNKTNMIHEPKYISPDAIIIEDKMCMGPHRASFKEMLDQLEHAVPIFVIGPLAQSDKFQDVSSRFRIESLPALPPQMSELLATTIGVPRTMREGATLIGKQSPLSFAQIVLPARLTHAHPDVAQVALHYPLGRFGICTLESQLFTQALGRKVHLKVLRGSSNQSPSIKDFPYQVDGLLIDMNQPERRRLAEALVEHYQQKLMPKEPSLTEADKVVPVQEEMPRLDVLAAKDAPVKASELGIVIDPSAEPFHPIDQAVARLSRFPRELKIAGLTLLVFGIFYLLIMLFRAPESEQGRIYSDSLKIFKEMHQGSNANRGVKDD